MIKITKPLPEATLLLADPNWKYANRLTGGGRTRFGSGADGHYECLKAQDIINPAITYDVPALAGPRSILFMWMTFPMMYDGQRRRPSWKPTQTWTRPNDALTVLQGWGFEYSTIGFVWTKEQKGSGKLKYGPGHYTASNAEICIIATRGQGVTPAAFGGKRMTPSIIREKIMEHSRKPDIHPLIEAMYPGVEKKYELFARREYPGWNCSGKELIHV